jgi:hypothetical protein
MYEEARMTHRAIMPMTMVVAVALATITARLAAQPDNPIVTLSVTLPDGRTQELKTADSRLATVSVKDGAEYGFRPTILDSQPWSRVVVTVFRMPTATQASEQLGEVELKTGGPGAQTKTTPSFKIAVVKVDPPAKATS